MNKPALLQYCAFSPLLERELHERFEVHRWFELDGAQRTELLAKQGSVIRAVVSGGHLGLPADLMSALPALAIIAINGVGVDKVDLGVARRRNIRVTTTPGVLTDDVADLSVGLVLALLRQLPAGDRFVRANTWTEREPQLARKVSGRRFGILGLGQIGQAIAHRLAAFGTVAYSSRTRKDLPYAYCASAVELAHSSQVLIVAAAANAETRNLVGRDVLDALGPEGYLVNVSRGALVDEPELIRALGEGRIAGAALDVFADEPRVPEALRVATNVVLTPHVGSATVETREAMARAVVANLDAWLAGHEPPGAVV